MNMRKDALVEAAPVFSLLPEWVAARNPEMVGNIGQVFISPGAVNVVPEECKFIVELRSQSIEDLNIVRNRLAYYANRNNRWKVKSVYRKDPVSLDGTIVERIFTVSKKEKLKCVYLPSGAGHDAQSFAPLVPTGMIFVPCRGGISHSPEETITYEQAANGCQILLKTLVSLANDPPSGLSIDE
jgi:acetylornithine deacetylase/succinyl-diaminopimelate desuccinylase-like protein